ncbi:MAG: NAD-dependent succinate-semialdehyde dehydrogenase [Deltaproteobacteria bacterium]|nr:NAD-dependent succinate-semialdehyde dehydrogenase [Deltaproteobacteria bacterium]
MSITTINPSTGQPIKTYREMSPDEIRAVIEAVFKAQKDWAGTAFSEREALFKEAALVLRKNKREYASLMAQEMGKPLASGGGEVDKCAWVCEYYADHAREFLTPRKIETAAQNSFVTFEPLGVVLAVMPWNFPFWQVFRFAAPSLMAGNCGILKHASCTTGAAVAIEDVFIKAGFPKTVFKSIIVSSQNMGAVIENPMIAAVTLTGSEPAGISVAQRAAAVLKKTVLELGGSDPYVILKDADLDEAARACVAARLLNTGQTCIAAKRYIVVKDVMEAFEKKVIQEIKKYVVGDPFDPTVTVGPMVQASLREELHQQVKKSIALGARCVLGGVIPDGPGFFYPPTLLTHVTKGMPVFDEETFGPVAVIISAQDEEEAILLANDTAFGLGAAVFTRDIKKGTEIASKRLHAGCCFVNEAVKSDPRLPFGGVKKSGYGRELSSFGILEFVNIKTVYVK